MHGLKPHTIQAIQNVFAKYPNIEKAILYGSRAKGNYRNGSDIDLTLVGKDLTLSEQFSIETELDDLLLPYKIDLSIYHKIENQDLIDHIDRVGIVFYEKESGEWEEVLIGEYIDLISGYAFKSKNFLENQIEGSLPVLKIKNVANGDVHLNGVQYHSYDDSLEKFVIEKGDILIAMTGNHPQAQSQVVGDVSRYRLKGKALLNQRVGKIVCFDTINEDFTYYFFKDDATHKYLANQSSGSANQANISKKNILEVPVNLPPLKEQQAIAEVLSSLDAKIDLLHRQNQTLEALAETLFRQWFDDKEFDSTVKDLVNVQNGYAFKSKDFKDFGVNKVIKIKNISGNKVDISAADFISEEVASKTNEKFKISTGDILFAMTGAEIGKMGIVETNTQNLWLNQRVGLLNEKYKGAKYLAYLCLQSDFGQDYIEHAATGSAQPNISSTGIEACPFPKLTKNQIIEYSNTISPFYDKVIFNLGEIKTLEKTRDTLLPKLMSGEVRVKTL